jgi:2'-5' RNA ligase
VIRAFVGVRISPDVIRKIFEVQSQLKQTFKDIRWVNQENFHFTIKFLGAMKEESVASILNVLERALGAIPSFCTVCRGIGVFPDIRKPRVLWVGLERERLQPLASEVERKLEPLGFGKEARDFKPHLTLGRWRDSAGSSEALKHELERWKNYDFGESWVKEVVLFQSVLKPDGAVYSPLGIVALGGP